LRVRLRLRTRWRALLFRFRWRFPPPPAWSDISGYGIILAMLAGLGIEHVEGDVIEIGALLGGGTYQLCKYFERFAPTKRVFAIDVFDPHFDVSTALDGSTMAQAYVAILEGRDQRSVYDDVTRSCTNLITINADSATVELPCEAIAYAHIDGNHDPRYVRSDFKLVWPAVASRGIVSFDDYGHDLPLVTGTVHELIGEYGAEIARVWTGGLKTIFIEKR
jgi:hypothetical protein